MKNYTSRMPFNLRLVLIWSLFLATFFAYWIQLNSRHEQLLAASEQNALLRAEQTVHALATQVDAKLMQIQFFVEHLTEHWLDHQPEVFNKLVNMGKQGVFKGDLEFVAVTDRDGKAIFTSTPTTQQHSFAMRDYFQQHASGNQNFTISQPLKNQLTGAWTLQFSHSFYENGEFAGVVIAAVRAEHFSTQFSMIYPDPADVVLLVSEQGEYLSRSQDLEQHLGRSVPDDRQFIHQPELTAGNYRIQAPIDGVERFYAWHRLEEFPLVLSLGLGKEKVLAPTKASIQRAIWQSKIASLLIMIAAIWITKLAYIKFVQARNLTHTQERLTTLLNRIPTAVLLEDENNQVVAVNPNFCQLFQLPIKPDSLLGLQHGQLLNKLDRDFVQVLGLPNRRQANYREEKRLANGITLELDWVAIWRANRFLGHGWFIQDISSRKRKEAELITLASTDPLTGLANRRSFTSALQALLAKRPQRASALLLLDIDHFKQVNDNYGHPAGDDVIRNVAQIMQSNSRQQDLCGRIGGEEFTVLMPNAELEQAVSLAERIRQQVEQAITSAEGHSIQVTISIGVTSLYGLGADSAQAKADAALYRAKQQGRNQVCV